MTVAISPLEDMDGAPFPDDIQDAFRTRVVTLWQQARDAEGRAATAERMRDDAVLHFATVVRAYGHIEFDKATLADTDTKRLTLVSNLSADPFGNKIRFEYRDR